MFNNNSKLIAILTVMVISIFAISMVSCSGTTDNSKPNSSNVDNGGGGNGGNGGNGGGNGGNGGNGDNGGGNNGGNDVNIEEINVQITGGIHATDHNPTDKATVKFNRFPKNEAEFLKLQELYGDKPEGAVMLQLMAFEMYRRDKTVGTKCIEHNSPVSSTGVKPNVAECTRRLKELFSSDANYARPYQIAAYLTGASYTNGYTPNEPYEIVVSVNPANPPAVSQAYFGYIRYLMVNCNGQPKENSFETEIKKRTIEVVRRNGAKLFLCNNCPSIYSQVAKLQSGEFKGLK